jgi:MSHA biogenesis protein MshL
MFNTTTGSNWQSRRTHSHLLRTGIAGLILGMAFSLWGGCSGLEQDAAKKQASVSPMLPAQDAFSNFQDLQVMPAAVTVPETSFSLEDRMLLSRDFVEPPAASPPSLGPLYSFRAQELPIIDALALFARSNRLNIVAGPEITGTVTASFQDLPLDQAMSALLEAHGYYWDHRQGLIQVKQFKTITRNVDYLRLIRSGAGQNRAQINSGSSGGSTSGSQDNGQISVNQEDEIKFWEELEKQITTLMSKDGRRN